MSVRPYLPLTGHHTHAQEFGIARCTDSYPGIDTYPDDTYPDDIDYYDYL
jgi:hypothetical protein